MSHDRDPMSTRLPQPPTAALPPTKDKKVAQSLLTLYCFHPHVNAASKALALLDRRVRDPIDIMLGEQPAILLFPEPSHNPPPWVKIIGRFAEHAKGLKNQSHSAIVLIEVETHVFALVFGRAQHLLPKEKLLRNFGLRTVINAVSPDDLRSIDMKSFESLAMHRRVQASSQSTIHRFGIDWTRDLVRAVTGTPNDPTFAKRVSGADALVICGNHTLEHAPGLCRRALEYYGSDVYRQTKWSHIDFLQPEYDPDALRHLDNELADAIISLREGDSPHLAIDDILDYTGVAGYSIQPSRRHYTANLDIKALQVFMRQHDYKTPLEWLKVAYVKVEFADAPVTAPRHRVYNSIDWSTRYRDRLYIFTSGIWLRVDQEYAGRLNTCISGLSEPTIVLPQAPHDIMIADKSKANDEKGEGLYVTRVASDKYSFLPIHPNSFKSELMNEAVEPCDILGSRGSLYYIKRGGESGGLSHLFTQGLAASLTLLTDTGYRRRLCELVDKIARDGITDPEEADLLAQTYCGFFPEQGLHPARLEICFVVIRNSSKGWPTSMPYLSKVSLYEACRRLREANFEVRLQCVTPLPHDPAQVRKVHKADAEDDHLATPPPKPTTKPAKKAAAKKTSSKNSAPPAQPGLGFDDDPQ